MVAERDVFGLKIIEFKLTMKSNHKELWFEVPSRREFINITSTIEDCLRESGVKEGLSSSRPNRSS